MRRWKGGNPSGFYGGLPFSWPFGRRLCSCCPPRRPPCCPSAETSPSCDQAILRGQFLWIAIQYFGFPFCVAVQQSGAAAAQLQRSERTSLSTNTHTHKQLFVGRIGNAITFFPFHSNRGCELDLICIGMTVEQVFDRLYSTHYFCEVLTFVCE